VGRGEEYHRPVLVEEVLRLLEPAARGEIMDGTVGGGGHARAILERYPECTLLAVDRDPAAIEEARTKLAEFGERVRFLHATFDEGARMAGEQGPSLAGALLDLGVSTAQLDRDERGFTFRPDAPLDGRMGGAGEGDETAAEILNEWGEDDLRRSFREYGEEPQARRLAKAITLLRQDRPFVVAEDLIEAMGKAYRRPPMIKEKARVFQALRVEVNREMDSIDAALPLLRDALLPGGVLAVLAYHSLEDRRVKDAFAEWNGRCTCPPDFPICVCGSQSLGTSVTRKPIRPSETEVAMNSRARSALLRGWRKAA
jgi:16S rRNA (cytosine1402-N4)-methyltransferase